MSEKVPSPGTLRAQRTSAGARFLPAAFSDSWVVIDSTGATVLSFNYHVHVGSQEWQITDGQGSPVGIMTRSGAHLHWTYDISLNNGVRVSFSKTSFALAHEVWRLAGASSGDIELRGSLGDHSFEFLDLSGNVVAKSSRPWASLKEAIDVEIMGADATLALCAAIALDSTEHESK